MTSLPWRVWVPFALVLAFLAGWGCSIALDAIVRRLWGERQSGSMCLKVHRNDRGRVIVCTLPADHASDCAGVELFM